MAADSKLPKLAHGKDACLAEFEREGFRDVVTYRRWRLWLHGIEQNDPDVSADEWVCMPAGGWLPRADAERELLRLQLQAAHVAANGSPSIPTPVSSDAAEASDADLAALLASAGYELEP